MEKDKKTIEPGERKMRRRMKNLQRFGLHALILVLAVWVIFFLVVGVTTVPNNDMHPRLDGGDLILYYRLNTLLEARDVITFHKNDTKYVARIVAIPGDSVDITDTDSLVVNKNAVYESDIFYSTPRYEGFVNYPLTLGADEYFVLVDFREGGEDSRYFGPVKRDEIDGVVITMLRKDGI